MKRCLLLLALASCAAPEPSVMAARVLLSPALQDDVSALSIFALARWRSNGVELYAADLRTMAVLPTDPTVDLLARVDVKPAEVVPPLEDVEPQSGVLVYVEAYDSAGTIIGNGCRDNVLVVEGETVNVEVQVHPIP